MKLTLIFPEYQYFLPSFKISFYNFLSSKFIQSKFILSILKIAGNGLVQFTFLKNRMQKGFIFYTASWRRRVEKRYRLKVQTAGMVFLWRI